MTDRAAGETAARQTAARQTAAEGIAAEGIAAEETAAGQSTDISGPVSASFAATSGGPDATSIARRLAAVLRVEDWLLAGLVILSAPLVVPSNVAAPFDATPLEGALRVVAAIAALACAAARTADSQAGGGAATRTTAGPGFLTSASVGPFTGAVLLVGITGAAALDLPSWAGSVLLFVAAAAMVTARYAIPPLPVVARRALVAPFVLVAGRLFWNVVGAVFTRPLLSGAVGIGSVRTLVTSPVFAFLLAFSAVYYAMLVYAPRQIAEREGGVVTWLVRYLLFVAGVSLGLTWLAALG